MKYKMSLPNVIIITLYIIIFIIVYVIFNHPSKINNINTEFINQIKNYESFDQTKINDYYNEYQISNNIIQSLNKINIPDYYNYNEIEKTLNCSIPLVNRKYYLSNSFVPNNLVEISNVKKILRDNETMLLNKSAYDAYLKLYYNLIDNGYDIYIFSAYRSYDKQINIYNSSLNKSYVAYPGHSEHQTGLAIDISTLDTGLTIHFENTKEFAYLKDNAHLFGFILRYPKDKEKITGYSYEPWHFRYVGIEHAKIIYENNLTLEEYIYNSIPL